MNINHFTEQQSERIIGRDYVECGFTRTSYRKLFWKLFRITQSGTHEIMFGFKAKRLFGNLWWVDLKSFRTYVDRHYGETFDSVLTTK